MHQVWRASKLGGSLARGAWGGRVAAATEGAAAGQRVPCAVRLITEDRGVVTHLRVWVRLPRHAPGLLPGDVVVAVGAHPNVARAVRVDADGLAVVPERAVAREHPGGVPDAVSVDARPIFPRSAVPRDCVPPDSGHWVQQRLPVKRAVGVGDAGPVASRALIAIRFVVLVEPVVKSVAGLVVDDSVRIVIPTLGGQPSGRAGSPGRVVASIRGGLGWS